MKIGIDARLYGPKQGGLGRYIAQLIKHLEQIDTINEYVIFLRKSNFNDYQPATINFKKVLADIPWYGWREQIQLPKIIRQTKVELMHFPHWNVPLFYNRPFVVTVHDLLLLHYPSRRASTLSFFSYCFKNLIFKLVLRHAVQQARHIITVSEFSKRDITSTLKINPKKITNAGQAPTLLKQKKTPEEQKIILEKYGLSKPYLLYVGVAYPHKNLEALVAAWQIFSQKSNRLYQLALGGEKNYFYKRLEKYLTAHRIQNVSILGFVPDEELPTLYQHAKIYVFPSLYEGFGLPPLEAMQYQTPICASNIPCLKEILNNAAAFFDPHNTNSIAQTIENVLNDSNKQQELKIQGQNRLKNYSWEQTARQILTIYQNQQKSG